MSRHVCKECGAKFNRNSNEATFCSLGCCWAWRKKHGNPGRFEKGLVPWNLGTVGVMKPNSGSFQVGNGPGTKQAIGDVTIRDDKSGKPRAWVKVAENGDSYDWKLRAVVVWEKAKGPIPKGTVIHHKDRDQLNDVLSNLEPLTRGEHLNEHRSEHEPRRKSNASAATKRRHAESRLRRQDTNPLDALFR